MDGNLYCAGRVLSALNQVFKSDVLETCVVWGESGLHGGAYNVVLDIRWGSEDPEAVRLFNALAPGRYVLEFWRNFFGAGCHLHIPGDGEFISTCGVKVPFQKVNQGGCLSARLTAHLDHGYPYGGLGFGLGYHLVRDVALSGSRSPCP